MVQNGQRRHQKMGEKKQEIRTGYKKDKASLEKMEADLERRLNRLTSFNSYMDKRDSTGQNIENKKENDAGR